MKREICILSSVKQIASPGWMHETSAQGWCTGKTQRDGMGREVEGGSGWGTHVNPWLIHVNVWQKPLQYCKLISLQLIKIKGKKEKRKKRENPKLLRDNGMHSLTGLQKLLKDKMTTKVSSVKEFLQNAPETSCKRRLCPSKQIIST